MARRRRDDRGAPRVDALHVVQLHHTGQADIDASFQCRTQHFMWCNTKYLKVTKYLGGFNAARSILCGATQQNLSSHHRLYVSMPHAAFYVVQPPQLQQRLSGARFQCRTQHFMWCNGKVEGVDAVCEKFQCRTQHFMWCNSVARSPCPARGERAFWKVVDFLCRFPLMGRNFHRKIAASSGVFPCAAQGCAKMENRDGRMRLCGIAVAFSTFCTMSVS